MADTDLIKRLIELEAYKKGVPSEVALALVQQESSLNPTAVGDRGRSRGLFQLQEAAATDAGIDPAQRHQIVPNIEGGVEYLRQSLDRAKGNVPLALEMYNKGPSLQGKGDPQYSANVLAQMPQQGAAVDTATRAAMEERLRAIQQHRQPQAPTAPAPPAQGLPTVAPQPGGAPAVLQYPGSAAPGPGVRPQSGTVEVPTPLPSREPSDLVIPIEKPLTAAPAMIPLRDLAAGQPQPKGWLETYLPSFAPEPPPPPGTPPVVDKAQRIREAFSSEEARQQELRKLAPATAVNVVGGAGGAALGGLVGGVPGAIGGELAGSAAARWLNVKMGWEEPGLLGDVLSVATPLGVRAAAPVAKAVIRHLPGSRRIGHELAEETLEALPGTMAPPTASQTLFQRAAQQNPPVPTTTLQQTARDLLAQELRLQPSMRQGRLLRTARELEDLSAAHGGQVPLDLLDQHRQRLGLMIRQASAENWPQLAGLRRLYASIYGDLDNAVAQNLPGAATLREGIQASRTEHALDELAGLWSPGRGITRVEGDVAQVSGKRILNQFDRMLTEDRVFAGSFAPEQRDAIRQTLTDVARMTSKPPTSGGRAGEVLRRVGQAAGIGTAAMGNIPLGVGMVVGMEAAPYVIAAALRTAPGRAAVRQAFQQGNGRLTAGGLAIINQAIRTEVGEEPTAPALSEGGP